MVVLCVLLWARAGMEAELVAYEDTVLALMADHDGRVLQRVRTDLAQDPDQGSGEPLEVHVLEFGSEDALAGYLADERRLALADQRDAAIERTQLMRVALV